MSVQEQLVAFGLFQWIGLIFGILYVIFAARNNVICWVFGIVSCASIAYVDIFTPVALYSDAFLQFIYILLGFYGIFKWMSNEHEKGVDLIIYSKKLQWHLTYIVLFSLLAYPFGKAVSYFFGGVFPLVDAWTTVLSIWATYLLAKRIIENWLYWIVLDFIYIFLYYSRDALLFAVLFIIYTIVSFYGFYSWSAQKRKEII
jgi:nicotinamide mononucleotide transporter